MSAGNLQIGVGSGSQPVGPGPICWGVKSGKRLVCGEPVNDLRVVDEVMRLVDEFLSRVERHKAVLLSDSSTPFDYAVDAMINWLQAIEGRIKEGSDENTANLRRAMREAGKKMLELARQAREEWLSTYREELGELLGKLRSGEATVVIRGEPLNIDKSFTVLLYTDHLAVKVERVAKSGSITVSIMLTGLDGVHVITPKLFSDDLLRPMRYGLLMTDATIDKGYPQMDTNQLWQAVVWPLTWPGRNYVFISSLGINDGDVKITWQLTAIDHRGVFGSKAEVAEEVLRLDDNAFITFLLTAVLGDGSVDTEKERESIRLTIGNSKYGLWRGIVERMVSLGFKEHDNKRLKVKVIGIYSSRAVALAQRWLGDLLIRALVEDLSQLPDAEKLRRLLTLASLRIKPLGRSMVEVIDGVSMNVHVGGSGYVELRAVRRNREDALAIQERLRNAGYDAMLRELKDGFVVSIINDEIKMHPGLVAEVCKILRRMHEEAISEGNKRRAWRVAKAMKKLNCPAQGPTGLKQFPYSLNLLYLA
ncbi:hypothetical protein [Vulcanisaeta distributa]|uniref:Uncharacterized protein n=1 Tax=Vulcanisaeta distributa (strain DSM 14429 / JCM 11212 / NBRC 100878 / IC-017) TaxID=572478 RepID=E1QNH0_VULDI|nr:hypothetical protein [Vulcanisaeta distributa]ADN51258.1 hypothetical protein Vdis_1886 [Vulcanisaeta distributa DSM 14429]